MKRNAGKNRKHGKIGGMALAILLVLVVGTGVVYILRTQVEAGCEKALAAAAEANRKEVASELNKRMVYLDMLARQLSGYGSESTLPDANLVKEMAKALEVGVFYDRDGQFFLPDGYSGEFKDSTMRDSVENSAYAVLAVDVPEINNRTCLTIVLPIFEKNKVCGMVFGYFDIAEFIEIFSRPVYENSGFSFLADKNGNVVVPASHFSSIDENGKLKLEGADNREELKQLVSNICTNKKKMLKVQADGAESVVYGMQLEEYTDLAVITMAESSAIYRNVVMVSTGIIIAMALLLVMLFVQFSIAVGGEKRKEKEIAKVVNYDELTGLANKPYHKQECTAILKKSRANYAYVVMDVCDFSAVNATCGYEVGNNLLKNIAKTLEAAIERNECCSRTSADHFAVLLKYENQEGLTQRIKEICEKAGSLPQDRRPEMGKLKKESIIFNCGVYLIQSNSEDINRIRARANTAKKSLKKAIKTQISFYNDDDFRKKMENHELEMDLLKAVDNKEMVVFLQPKYDAATETMNGAEALVRWNHPTKGLLGPNMFIPVAEEDGFVKVIDFHVFEVICEKLKEWKEKGYRKITVSVNFSRLHMVDADFIQHLNKVADKYGVDHDQLEIELTESADFNDMDILLNVMYKIKEAGFGLAMDDFGTGYSSLQLLMKMPVGVLKMDKSFIEDCNVDNEMDNKMAAGIISLAQGRGHSVVAEGVETAEQKDILKDANCDTFQGYYYSKPITMQAFEALMKD